MSRIQWRITIIIFVLWFVGCIDASKSLEFLQNRESTLVKRILTYLNAKEYSRVIQTNKALRQANAYYPYYQYLLTYDDPRYLKRFLQIEEIPKLPLIFLNGSDRVPNNDILHYISESPYTSDTEISKYFRKNARFRCTTNLISGSKYSYSYSSVYKGQLPLVYNIDTGQLRLFQNSAEIHTFPVYLPAMLIFDKPISDPIEMTHITTWRGITVETADYKKKFTLSLFISFHYNGKKDRDLCVFHFNAEKINPEAGKLIGIDYQGNRFLPRPDNANVYEHGTSILYAFYYLPSKE